MNNEVLEVQFAGLELTVDDWLLLQRTGIFVIGMRKGHSTIEEINAGLNLCESCMALLSQLGIDADAFMDYWQKIGMVEIVAFQTYLTRQTNKALLALPLGV